MILIDTHTPKTFEDYLLSLNKKSRRGYRETVKKTKGLEFKKVPYNREDVVSFMKLWENQIIYGAKRKWSFGIDYVDRLNEKKRLMCFGSFKGDEMISLRFLENHNGYVESHPTMYDKTKYLSISLAHFGTFSLIKYAIENDGMDWIDLGGKIDSWREMIKKRKELNGGSYKWLFVPSDAKKNPDNQPNLILRIPEGKQGNIKYLEEI